MIYTNLGGALAGVVDKLSPEQRQALSGFASDMKPTLITLYGGEDQITLASSGSLLGLTLNQILSMQGPAALLKQGTQRARPAYPR